MHRIVGALAVAVVLAGCGSTDWKAAKVSPSASPKSAQSASTAAAERPYVDAMVVSAQAQGSDKSGVSPTTIQCMATAVVDGYGASAFAAAGITPAALRDPNSTLDALPDPSDDRVTSIGTALQHCNIGRAVALGFAEGVKINDAASITCLAGRFSAGPGARRFLVLSVLQRHADLEAAHGLIGLFAGCVDLPALVLRAANVHVDTTTWACLLDTLKTSGAALKDFMALKIAGSDTTSQEETLAVSINHCRPGARTGFTVPAG
ncbi:MAG: hypothetical protein M3Q30_08055 [Actinomycetota bacterium]|nr:hypothetical protein [Actinomycetota bacterium]